MNKYGLALVVSAKIEDDARTATVEKAKDYIVRAGGTVTEAEATVPPADSLYASSFLTHKKRRTLSIIRTSCSTAAGTVASASNWMK